MSDQQIIDSLKMLLQQPMPDVLSVQLQNQLNELQNKVTIKQRMEIQSKRIHELREMQQEFDEDLYELIYGEKYVMSEVEKAHKKIVEEDKYFATNPQYQNMKWIHEMQVRNGGFDNGVYRQMLQAGVDKKKGGFWINHNDILPQFFDIFRDRLMTIEYRVGGTNQTKTVSFFLNQQFFNKMDIRKLIESNGSFENVFVKYNEQWDGDDIEIISIFVRSKDKLETNIATGGRVNQRHTGLYFNKLNTSEIDLSRYQIGKNLDEHKKLNNEHCLIYALRQTKLFDDQQLKAVNEKMLNCNMCFSQQNLKRLGIDNKIVIHRIQNGQHKYFNKIATKKAVDENLPEIRLALYNNHYFIDDKMKYGGVNTTSLKMVMDLDEKGWFDEITISNNMNRVDVKKMKLCVDDIGDVESQQSEQKFKNKGQKCFRMVCADFEAFTCDKSEVVQEEGNNKVETNNIKHQPFMLCAKMNGKNFEFYNFDKFMFYFDGLSHEEDYIVYFHNLSYDVQFILQSKFKVSETVISNGRIISFKIWMKNHVFQFMDSYMIFGCKLSKLPEMFGLEVKKEIFPYTFYTNDRYEQDVFDIAEVYRFVDQKYSFQEFKQCVKESMLQYCDEFIANECMKNGKMSLKNYCAYYCAMDVEVLYQSITKFKQILSNKPFEMDLYSYITISGLALDYQKKMGCFDNVYNCSGVLRRYLNQFIIGGRVMTCQNKMVKREGVKLQDFDAVSLYPSAQSFTYYPAGKCQVMSDDDIMYYNDVQNLMKITQEPDSVDQSTFFARVKVVRGDGFINRNFPLLRQKYDENGVMLDRVNFTNEPDEIQYMNDIQLQDAVKFQRFQYEILDGVIYKERNYKIREVVNFMFNERLKAKKEKNPIQQVYKLMLNSSYGKTIMKDHDQEIIIAKDDWINIAEREQHRLQFVEHFDGINVIHLNKETNTQHTYPQVGCQILAMSKRLMNQVMCLAEDLKVNIYYQDTDSMQIEEDGLKIVEQEFRKIYGRELIGKQMGQYHSDYGFEEGDERANTMDILHCDKIIALGKKAYICRLVLSDKGNDKPNGEFTYHIRMKGVSSCCLPNNDETYKVYCDLYDGQEKTFDLASGQVMMKRTAFNSYENIDEFLRTVKFDGEKLV